ncbi:glycoside hydrolase family 3 C-terminal domain-containing protein [Georgenia alba]|uniref:Glycoside hydrolase family 3 C-terminal domain-containing protein n=1 Tax=Georgenia alba TaxID=2233858 RepID=A0ABW2Q909_9MICO
MDANTDAQQIVAALTLEEKVSLLSGETFWTTTPAPGLESITVADGPHGVRKVPADSGAIGGAEPATCFPPAVALGATFDLSLVERVGAAIAAEARALGVDVVLGPGVNIKRSPLCGRNFEYVSEDPLVAGEIGTAMVRGIQSGGAGTSLKHYAANNQETERKRISADIDERTLREIYLKPFQRVVQQAAPTTVMSSYNRVNGTYVGEDRRLLTDILREEWGFDGLVMSDWGAVDDRIAGVRAGLDLEMPHSGEDRDRGLLAAVRDGRLTESDVDACVTRLVRLVHDCHARAATPAPQADPDAHHALAREAAGRAVVLLKNDDGLLPLAPQTRVAVVGELARTPRYQGAGSSQIVPTRLDDALAAIRDDAAGEVAFAPGYTLEEDASTDEGLAAEAVAAARDAEVVLFFAGLPDWSEAEGRDRPHIDLPAVQLDLLDRVLEANPRVIVVLSNGSVVRLARFADRVPAIVEGWLLGQAGGGATADVLYGRVNPSGRLTETVPLRLEDTPAHLSFPGGDLHVTYGEGIFVGYRWYDGRDMPVQFPFGHGLSYTSFEHADLAADDDGAGGIRVRVRVTNTGARAGREVVQCYLGKEDSEVPRPPRALAAFAVVDLEPGGSRVVELAVPRADLAYWSVRHGRWMVEGGAYRVDVGASSRDVRCTVTVDVPGEEQPPPLTRQSSVAEMLAHPVAGRLVESRASDLLSGEMVRLISSMPVGRLPDLPGSGVTADQVDQMLAVANGEA